MGVCALIFRKVWLLLRSVVASPTFGNATYLPHLTEVGMKRLLTTTIVAAGLLGTPAVATAANPVFGNASQQTLNDKEMKQVVAKYNSTYGYYATLYSTYASQYNFLAYTSSGSYAYSAYRYSYYAYLYSYYAYIY